jgi:hypothetical protein
MWRVPPDEAMRQPIDARVIPEIPVPDYAAFHGMIKLLPPSYDRWWLYHDTALRKRGGSGRDDRPVQKPLAEPGASHWPNCSAVPPDWPRGIWNRPVRQSDCASPWCVTAAVGSGLSGVQANTEPCNAATLHGAMLDAERAAT